MAEISAGLHVFFLVMVGEEWPTGNEKSMRELAGKASGIPWDLGSLTGFDLGRLVDLPLDSRRCTLAEMWDTVVAELTGVEELVAAALASLRAAGSAEGLGGIQNYLEKFTDNPGVFSELRETAAKLAESSTPNPSLSGTGYSHIAAVLAGEAEFDS